MGVKNSNIDELGISAYFQANKGWGATETTVIVAHLNKVPVDRLLRELDTNPFRLAEILDDYGRYERAPRSVRENLIKDYLGTRSPSDLQGILDRPGIGGAPVRPWEGPVQTSAPVAGSRLPGRAGSPSTSAPNPATDPTEKMPSPKEPAAPVRDAASPGVGGNRGRINDPEPGWMVGRNSAPENSTNEVIQRLYRDAIQQSQAGRGSRGNLEFLETQWQMLSAPSQGRIKEAWRVLEDLREHAQQRFELGSRMTESNALSMLMTRANTPAGNSAMSPAEMVAVVTRWHGASISAPELARAARISIPNAEAALRKADQFMNRFGGLRLFTPRWPPSP